MKKIFIVGAGAIGKALAVFLAVHQRDVIILRGSTDHISPAREEINVDLSTGVTLSASVEISSLSHFETLEGIIVLTNKAFGNTQLANALKTKAANSPIVVLQNGLHVEEPFLAHFPCILRCVLFATSQATSPTTLRFKPVSVSPIGVIKGNRDDAEKIVDILDTPNFRFSVAENIQEIVWKKVIANCVFNSICPLLDTDNGIFHRNEKAMKLARRVIAECVTVAHTAGINLSENDIIDTVLLISKSSDGQLISTLQDIRNGCETEIESLNFAVVKIARELNLSDRISTTQLLGELTLLKSNDQRQ